MLHMVHSRRLTLVEREEMSRLLAAGYRRRATAESWAPNSRMHLRRTSVSFAGGYDRRGRHWVRKTLRL